MRKLNNETSELSFGELDAVIGAGSEVLPNEQIHAHFVAVHEHETVGMSRYRFPGKSKH